MCGIAGVWGRPETASVQGMMDRQAHRGPDGQGMHIQPGKGALGHVRLSIMDPDGGTQPIYNEDRSAVIIANGEIYNHESLRRGLDNRHAFTSTSDSETILHLFEDQGQEAVRNLDGMFAFAVINKDDLFLARDPIGIKPLYFGRHQAGKRGETIYFASELKAIPGWVEESGEFPPGTYYHSGAGFRSYYTLPGNRPQNLPVETHIKRLRRTLEGSVVKRLMSDVPLGAFLSGGLDSSIIAAIARRHMDVLHTFSVGIEGSRDLEAARRVARHIGSVHHEYVFSVSEILEKLPEIIYHLESFDQDLVRSAIPTFFCARMASETVKVILTGEGADELFAGYAYHKDIPNLAALNHELHDSVGRLHNLNLQRVDRLTMCHGLEGRVPFLDTRMVALAHTIPPEWKLHETGNGKRIEKWILRKAFEDLLPLDIVWRDKAQFDEGSGTVDLLPDVIRTAAGAINPSTYAARYPAGRLRSLEECLYHKMLTEAFEQPWIVLDHVSRWRL